MGNTTFAEVAEEFKQTAAIYRQGLEGVSAEVKKLGIKYEELAKWPGEDQAKFAALDKKLDELETKLRRLPTGGGDDTSDAKAAQTREKKDIYFKMLRAREGYAALDPAEQQKARDYKLTVAGMGAEERKALSLSDDTLGGFLAPVEFVQDIIKGVQLISPIRQFANVRQTSRRTINYPVRTGVMTAQWVGETSQRSETTGLAYSLEEIPVYEMYAEVIVSEQDLEDSVFDLEREILDNCSEQFAKAEGAAFVNGDALKKPEGYMTNANVSVDFSGNTAQTGLASTGLNANGDGIVGMAYNIKSAYVQGAYWLLARQTVGSVRKLTDSQKRYLWEPNWQAGTPPTILGIPYIEVPDMPLEASLTFPLALANLKRGYLIVDRVDVVIKRLQEKYAEQGQIAYIVRKRVGGQVVIPEAIRKMQCHA